jgi:hypothetical protein
VEVTTSIHEPDRPAGQRSPDHPAERFRQEYPAIDPDELIIQYDHAAVPITIDTDALIEAIRQFGIAAQQTLTALNEYIIQHEAKAKNGR